MADSESSRDARQDDPVDGPAEPDWVAPPPLDPEERTFDAFDEDTWNFTPAPTPWYRTGHAAATVVVVSIAAIALVVSIVLLAFRGPSRDEKAPVTETSTTPSTTTEAPETTTEEPPPPPPPPPPTTASEINQAPVVVAPAPKPTRKPEINVTRSSLSASPPKPPNR